MDLKGKTAFVTGASYGIGRAMAIGFARKGCNLVLMARNRKSLEETAERLLKEKVEVKLIVKDASNWDEIKNLSSEVGQIDILYNGIANWVDKDFQNVTAEEINQTINSVYKANLLVTKVLLTPIISSKGTIINMVSDWGLYEMSDKPALFGSAKVALSVFGDLLRKELALTGVRVVNIYPTEVSSALDIDNLTYENASTRLQDLVKAVIDIFSNDKKEVISLYISNLSNNLELDYK